MTYILDSDSVTSYKSVLDSVRMKRKYWWGYPRDAEDAFKAALIEAGVEEEMVNKAWTMYQDHRTRGRALTLRALLLKGGLTR